MSIGHYVRSRTRFDDASYLLLGFIHIYTSVQLPDGMTR